MISPYAHQFLEFIANTGCLAHLRCRNVVARAEMHPEPDTTAFLANLREPPGSAVGYAYVASNRLNQLTWPA
jgi:hypothetical protein